MPIFEIEDPDSGRVIELEGPSQPTEAELKNIFGTIASEERQEGRSSIDFTSPFVPFGKMGIGGTPLSGSGLLQNIGAVAQREESAIAGPILEIQRGGSLREAGQAFLDGLTGKEQVELGDVFAQAGYGESEAKLFGFLSSLGLPTNFILNAFLGGSGTFQKGVQKSATVTGANQIKKGFESIINKTSGVTRKTFKDLQNLIDKHGVKKLFNTAVEQPDFIGSTVTPKVTQAIKEKALNFDKQVLKEFFKVQDSLIDDVIDKANKFGIKKIPSVKEADELFDAVIANAPDDIVLPVAKVIDSIDESVKILGDQPLTRSLIKIRDYITQNKGIDSFLRSKPIEMSKQEYLTVRGLLNRARKGDPQITRFVDEIKGVLDDVAEESGVKGIKEAKANMYIARNMERPFSNITKESLDESVLTKLKKVADENNVPNRKLLERILGKETTDEIFDLIEANKILNKKLKQSETQSILGIIGKISRKGQKEFAERVEPQLREIRRSGLGRFGIEAGSKVARALETGTLRQFLKEE